MAKLRYCTTVQLRLPCPPLSELLAARCRGPLFIAETVRVPSWVQTCVAALPMAREPASATCFLFVVSVARPVVDQDWVDALPDDATVIELGVATPRPIRALLGMPGSPVGDALTGQARALHWWRQGLMALEQWECVDPGRCLVTLGRRV